MTSAMSARMSRRVTAESRARAALTMVPRFTEEQGSSANSWEATRIESPAEGDQGETERERERESEMWLRLEVGQQIYHTR